LLFEDLLLFGERRNVDDLVLVDVEFLVDEVLKLELLVDDKLAAHDPLDLTPVLRILLHGLGAQSHHYWHGSCELSHQCL
jgi:hypothetical protein